MKQKLCNATELYVNANSTVRDLLGLIGAVLMMFRVEVKAAVSQPGMGNDVVDFAAEFSFVHHLVRTHVFAQYSLLIALKLQLVLFYEVAFAFSVSQLSGSAKTCKNCPELSSLKVFKV